MRMGLYLFLFRQQQKILITYYFKYEIVEPKQMHKIFANMKLKKELFLKQAKAHWFFVLVGCCSSDANRDDFIAMFS